MSPADEPAGIGRPQEGRVERQRGDELARLEHGEQRGAYGVVEHRRQEPFQDVAPRGREGVGGRERDVDHGVVDVGADELEAEGGRGRRQWPPACDRVPERPSADAHAASASGSASCGAGSGSTVEAVLLRQRNAVTSTPMLAAMTETTTAAWKPSSSACCEPSAPVFAFITAVDTAR